MFFIKNRWQKTEWEGQSMSSELFDRERMLLGDDALKRLKSSHVAVFGLGGVGSWCAEALARAGVGRLTIVDGDRVSVTNINRQLCALNSTVGRPKTEVMRERLLDINPALEVRDMFELYTAETRERFFSPAPDLIVDAIDMVSAKIDLILTAKARGVPILCSLGTGNKLDASRLRFADIYKTSVCPLARVMRTELRKRGVDSLEVLYSDEPPLTPRFQPEDSGNRRGTPGSVSWVPPAAGLRLAGRAVEILLGGFKCE